MQHLHTNNDHDQLLWQLIDRFHYDRGDLANLDEGKLRGLLDLENLEEKREAISDSIRQLVHESVTDASADEAIARLRRELLECDAKLDESHEAIATREEIAAQAEDGHSPSF